MTIHTVNPHPPTDGDTDTVTCAGCGHPVSGNDDVMAWDDDDGGLSVSHVVCAPDDRLGTLEFDRNDPGPFACERHPDRPAVAYLEWSDDYTQTCAECLVPRLNELWETLQDMELGVPEITIRPI